MACTANSAKLLALCLLVFASELIARHAAAQHYEGCFVNGQQVSDAMCKGGGATGSGGSLMSSPMYGDLMSMSRALGGAIVKSLMSPPEQGGGSTSPSPAHAQSVSLNNDGVSLFDQHRVTDAIERFRQAVAADPTNAVAQANYWHAKSVLDHQAGNDDFALSDVQQALRFNSQFPAAQADKTFYEQLVAARQARQRSDADARALAARLSLEASDADARSLADRLAEKARQKQAAADAQIVEPGDTLKDSLNGNQSLSPPKKQQKGQKTSGSGKRQAHAKQVFNTEKECQTEYDRRAKVCEHPDYTDAKCVNDQLKWKDACEAQLPPEGWGR